MTDQEIRAAALRVSQATEHDADCAEEMWGEACDCDHPIRAMLTFAAYIKGTDDD